MRKKEDLAQKIMEYLRRNPEAGDTLEGITNWWLQFQRIEQSINDVLDSLEDLIEEGLVRREEVHGGEPYYKVCKRE